jgi:Arc/MetJ-type ribon-helix-helix transcriptional regulator
MRPRKLVDPVAVNIYLPTETVTALDSVGAGMQRATSRRVSRSDVIRLAIEEFLQRGTEHAKT